MILALGSKKIEGGVHRTINSAGELKVSNAMIGSLRSAGSAVIKNCKCERLSSAGEAKIWDSQFDRIEAAGSVTMHGEITCERFILAGAANVEHMKAKVFRFGLKRTDIHSHGVRLRGRIEANTYENFVRTTLDYDFTFKNILSYKEIYYPHELQCEQLFSFGKLYVDVINCEHIYIRPAKGVKVNILHGSRIIVDPIFNDMKAWDKIDKTITLQEIQKDLPKLAMIHVKEMEGDYLELDYVSSKRVSGHDVVIHDHCEIDRVEYQNSIEVSNLAKVKEIVKI